MILTSRTNSASAAAAKPTAGLHGLTRWLMPLGAALLGLFLWLSFSPQTPLAGAQAGDAQAGGAQEARAEYVRSLEPVCFRDTRRNIRILKGVKEQVRRGQYRIATKRFMRATRAYTQTLRVVIRTPRPAADRQTLNEWLQYLLKQRSYLAQITRALQSRDGFEAQRLSVLLGRNAQQANETVRGFGFKHCLVRPNRFL